MAVNTRSDRDVRKYSLEHIQNQGFDQEFQVPVSEGLGYDGQSLQRMLADSMTTMLDYVGGANPIYIGMAAPGTATSAAKWQIRKLTYDGSNNVLTIKYAGGTPSFDQVYDDRASLSYS